MGLLTKLGVKLPIIQAPMAGTSTPALAAAVSNSGALGSIGVGATDAEGARAMIRATRKLTDKPFNVNLFVHAPPSADSAGIASRDKVWIETLTPHFTALGATPPTALHCIYETFATDQAMLAMLVEEKPAVVSFHFGIPPPEAIRALKATGATLLASATNVAEARAAQAAGIDAIVAQGIEAGGHRGTFDPVGSVVDQKLSTSVLLRLLTQDSGISLPLIAAGGIMDGAGILSALDLGAEAAQLGTAFIACPESGANDAYRALLLNKDAAGQTEHTKIISGRLARSLPTSWTRLQRDHPDLPSKAADYPNSYDIAKSLMAAASKKGDSSWGAYWAGMGAPLARELPAQELVRVLAKELEEARRR